MSLPALSGLASVGIEEVLEAVAAAAAPLAEPGYSGMITGRLDQNGSVSSKVSAMRPLMTPNMHARLAALHDEIASADGKAAQVFVPVGPDRDGNKPVILFVGQTTSGWAEEERAEFARSWQDAAALVAAPPSKSGFWQVVRQITAGVAAELGLAGPDGRLDDLIAWSNVVKVGHPDRNPDEPSWKVQADLCVEQLRQEIEELKPVATVLLTRNFAQREVVEPVFGADGWSFDTEGQDRVAYRTAPSTVVWMNHPRNMGASGYRRASVDLAIRLIVEAARARDGVDTDAAGQDEEAYVAKVRCALDEAEARQPSGLASWLSGAISPVTDYVADHLPSGLIESALGGSDWLAKQTLTRAGSEVFDSLRACDEKARQVVTFHLAIAATEGGVAGAVGIFALPFDVAALVILALRVVRQVGVEYGYAEDDDFERDFCLAVLRGSSANSVKEKVDAQIALNLMARTTAKKTWKSMATATFGPELAVTTVRTLSKQLGINLTKRKVGEIVPLIGAAVGAATNAQFINKVGSDAQHAFQKRWLNDRDASRASAEAAD